jgi:hypothetical protein
MQRGKEDFTGGTALNYQNLQPSFLTEYKILNPRIYSPRFRPNTKPTRVGADDFGARIGDTKEASLSGCRDQIVCVYATYEKEWHILATMIILLFYCLPLVWENLSLLLQTAGGIGFYAGIEGSRAQSRRVELQQHFHEFVSAAL